MAILEKYILARLIHFGFADLDRLREDSKSDALMYQSWNATSDFDYYDWLLEGHRILASTCRLSCCALLQETDLNTPL